MGSVYLKLATIGHIPVCYVWHPLDMLVESYCVRYGQQVEGTGRNSQFYANIIRQSCGRVLTDTVRLPMYDCYLIFPLTSPL